MQKVGYRWHTDQGYPSLKPACTNFSHHTIELTTNHHDKT